MQPLKLSGAITMLEKLNCLNDMKIYSVFDSEFCEYGRIIENYDFSKLIEYAEKETDIPKQNNIYVASDKNMEALEIAEIIKNEIFGEMPIQIGYCNGVNSTYNGFEYHKCSEINIAVTDFCLVLGRTGQIKDNKFYIGDEKVFFVPKGICIEMFQTTLHLSPCRVYDEGFKDIVILLKGTNTPLSSRPVNTQGENGLLLQKNKWVLAHPERKQLISQGAYPGLIGENKKINY